MAKPSLEILARPSDAAIRHVDTIELSEGSDVTLGRSAGSQVHVPDQRISGRHAIFKMLSAAQLVSVSDHSTNGTYVNGFRLAKDTPATLADGDVHTRPPAHPPTRCMLC